MMEFTCQATAELGENKIAICYEDSAQGRFHAGSPVMLSGSKKTVAQLVISDEVESGHMLMGATMRINADVAEGDVVSLAPVDAQVIQKIRFQPLAHGIDEGDLERAVKLLGEVYVSKGDRFVATVNGEQIEVCASAIKPAHGWLVPNTRIVIKPTPVRRKGENIPSVSFEDIGGLDETIEEVKEIAIVPLVHPEVYQKAGQDPPKGILLYGPPGVGKTLLAKALAREAQCNFISINGPELFSANYGESEKKLREVFAQAKKEAPSVIYIDEIDAISGSRKDGKGQLEKRILTQLLTELDGFEERGQVLVVGSTNMMDSIDGALLRAGRFDRRIHVPYPDISGREQILTIHSSSMPLEAEFALEDWARKTNGFTGADLANLCRHAAVVAMRRVFGERLKQQEPLSDEELSELEILDEDFSGAMVRATPYQLENRRPANMGYHDMDQVIGHEQAKQELREHLVLPILHKEKFAAMGLNCNGGVILHGPPGTGKTMLGKAAASLSEVQFMAVSGPELLSKWVGESERAVRELFQAAQEAAPVVIFFDEFDALGRQRDGGEGSSHSNSVVAQLLSIMDGLGNNEDIYLMASTNQIELVDRAFLRPGRFERAIHVGPLPKNSFKRFFENEVKECLSSITEDQWTVLINRMVDEATGADLFGLINTAKRYAVSRSIEHGESDASLEERDMIAALASSPHLFAGYANELPEPNDWNDDDDDDWVIP
ncbi:MAG: AAA family ATPase [Euryarchaeota archaeon]|jgi:transitional endoplasmic reticulum ATPase|nr:AAA family ATPase [Euryarchaeota archaeon]